MGFLTLKWNLVLDYLILKRYFPDGIPYYFRIIFPISKITATLLFMSYIEQSYFKCSKTTIKVAAVTGVS